MTTPWDYLAAFITIGALAIGLLSMLVGMVAGWLQRRSSLPRPRAVMSRRARPPLRSRHAPVYISVSRYGGMVGGMENPKPAKADIDAPNSGMEPMTIGRDIMNDAAFITFLARQKTPNGKYRLSANKIFEVKQVRATPQYRPLTDDKKTVTA
jgi:hypothetical protein